MQNILVLYKGGSGGFFIYYYILGSDSNIFACTSRMQIGEHKKLLDSHFYRQFKKHIDLKDWKKTEISPTFEKTVCEGKRQIFLDCDSIPKNFDLSNTVIVNPYISDKMTWLRIQVTKRCRAFFQFPKNSSYKDFFNHYKTNYKKSEETSEIKGSDYSFDFLNFLRYKSEREKLCNFLKININTRMEDYLEHYIDCHGDFLDRFKENYRQ